MSEQAAEATADSVDAERQRQAAQAAQEATYLHLKVTLTMSLSHRLLLSPPRVPSLTTPVLLLATHAHQHLLTRQQTLWHMNSLSASANAQ